MKSLHPNFVALLVCFATVYVCFGHKPLRGTRPDANKISEPIDPENPPSSDGRSVYDPEIYNKYKGIEFQDQIPAEELEEAEKTPNMPSYPWRGGGHVPMPLTDPVSLKARKVVTKYIMGFRNCTELLNDFDDDEEEGDVVEEGEKMTEDSQAQDSEKYSDDEELKEIELHGDELQSNEEEQYDGEVQTRQEEKTEADEQTFESGSQQTGSSGFVGVGAVSVIGRDFSINTFTSDGSNVGSDAVGNGDGDEYYPYYDNNDEHDENQPAGGYNHDGDERGDDDDGDVKTVQNDVATLTVGTMTEPMQAGHGYLYQGGDAQEEDDERRAMDPEACRVCVPCCKFLAELAATKAQADRRRMRDECSPDDSERGYVSAECSACHVRRRPPHLGVVLTCFQCAQQQGDRTCRLGAQNGELSHYRVSSKFFLTTESNATETTATQHSALVERLHHTAALDEVVLSRSGPIDIPHSFIINDDEDLYPFESEDQEKESGNHSEHEEAEKE